MRMTIENCDTDKHRSYYKKTALLNKAKAEWYSYKNT